MNEKDEILNEDWINEFEKTDKLFRDFYLDDIYYTEIHFIYINNSNNIEKIKEENFLLQTPNYISRKEIIELLKSNKKINDKKYSLLDILKCNITLKPEEIKNFLKSSNTNDYLDNFLQPIKNLDNIIFEKTINMFQDLNDLLFIFYEKTDEENKISVNNVTKMVYLIQKKKYKNSTRKQHKDY